MARNVDRLAPDDALMKRIEDAATDRILDALQAWARAIFRGATAADVQQILRRLDDRSLAVPLVDAIVDVLREIGYMGADIGRQHYELALRSQKVNIGVDWELVNSDVLRWVLDYTYSLVRGLTDTTRDRLAIELARFVESGEPLPKLVQRLSDPEQGMFGKARARRIAVTETTRAYAEGNLAAWRAGGFVEQRQWQTAADERVCPVCGPMQGIVAGINEPFRHPRLGAVAIPAHVGCRCWHVPYVDINVPDDWQPTYVTVEFR